MSNWDQGVKGPSSCKGSLTWEAAVTDSAAKAASTSVEIEGIFAFLEWAGQNSLSGVLTRLSQRLLGQLAQRQIH